MDPSGVSMKALERAVAVVNRIVIKSSVQPGKNDSVEGKAKGRWTKISAKAKGQTLVQEVAKPERSLAKYLALPVEEYSLLDPSWITREPDSNVFCLSAPVRGITGVNLEPKVWVTVDVDAEKGTVSFRSDRTCTGDASMDARLKLSFEGKLWQQPPKSRRASSRLRPEKVSKSLPQSTACSSSAVSETSPEGGHSSSASLQSDVSLEQIHSIGTSARVLQQSEPEAGWNGSTSPLPRQIPTEPVDGPQNNSSAPRGHFLLAAAEHGAGPAATQESSASVAGSTLHANARVWASVRLGPPLNVVPGFLISYTGGLIATAVLQALMPSVLELLARDYATWASGEQRAELREPVDAAAPAAELVHP